MPAAAQTSAAPLTAADDDRTVVYELGWAGQWSRAEGVEAAGATFAFEVTPIERWLELEIGVSAIRSGSTTEVPVDLLFKKPWQFSPTFEFMIGAGPELIHAFGPEPRTFWGLSGVLDFMFWPRPRIGWYLEPGYEVTFRDDGRRHGVAMAAGLLIGR